MSDQDKPVDRLIHDLQERAKELNCLYKVQELLGNPKITLDEICRGIIKALPPGWQYPDICQAQIILEGKTFESPHFSKAPWEQSSDILVQDEPIGRISVYYTEERPREDEGPFLKEERKLIDTIAEQLGYYILNQQLREVFEEQRKSEKERKEEWWVILNLLRRTDPKLLVQVSRKMINFLCWNQVPEAERLLEYFSPAYQEGSELLGINRPYEIKTDKDALTVSDDVFELAGKYLSEENVLENIHQWIKEEQSDFLINVLVNPGSSLDEISSVIERYHRLALQGLELSGSRERSVRVSLIRRLLSDQPEFIDIAVRYLEVVDFIDLLQHTIYPVGSHGKVGGKGSGLFLAMQILKKSQEEGDLIHQVRTPKTWYIASDNLFFFMGYNGLEDIVEQKYKDLNQVRQDYPYVVHVFKNSSLPPEIVKGLSLALDDFGDVPLIVRSSSLLEDRTGMAFAGKYKSLFIANRGTKEERLKALIDAIAEVYASMFGPDPIEYRIEHGLIDHHEEMGILIQEVVGTKVGHYYFPAYAGVAFSSNEFPWSSRIKREDGLVRMVPGLGTRAVDRLSNDYPILAAPGQPGLRVNTSLDEIIRYSPSNMDVIDLETGSFTTIDIPTLLKEYGREVPGLAKMVSVFSEDHIYQPHNLRVDFESDNLVITFEALFSNTTFLKQIQATLNELQDKFMHPVDIEFASDGTDFYLLQCRSQSYQEGNQPAPIPRGIPVDKILFSADRYITNGTVPNITHLVYIDPQKYSDLPEHQDLITIARIVGRLNKILQRRQFILMGPGRWGSRGDLKLGVPVTYSDISNTAMLIEIARKRGDYLPDPSFGTHFFQDLVEASIRYLPLYPDNSTVQFNQEFFTCSKNALPELLPEFAELSEVVRVIDIPQSTGGLVLQIFMNADVKEAVAVLAEPRETFERDFVRENGKVKSRANDEVHWQWRLQSVENIAARLDPERFGVKGFYIFGSTKGGTAGPKSDIDVLIHFQGSQAQRKDLLTWLDGCSLGLSQINYLRTGYKTNGLLDVHLITDQDIRNRSSYAIKIGATSDAARPLPLGTALKKGED
jgi:pyruvate,water dikinase